MHASRRSIRIAILSLVFVLATLSTRTASAADDIAGNWTGAIEIPSVTLKIEIEFSADEDGGWTGTISIPQQNAEDLELSDISLQDGQVSFALPAVPGDASFAGTVAEDGQRIAGDFTQSGQTFPWFVERGEEQAANASEALEGFADWLEEAREAWEVPAMSVAIVVNDEVIFADGLGLRDVEANLRADADTLFAIGSCTKAFTALAMGQLVEQGKLDWDAQVRDYVPFFRMEDEVAGKEMTPRDLVTHRSGLPRHDLTWYGRTKVTRAELVAGLRYLEPSASFRSTWQYNNLMFITAGHLVEQITGRTWEEVVLAEILEPLGMHRSNFSVLISQGDDNFAYPYRMEDGSAERIPFRRLDHVGPAGSINSSSREMANWLRLQLRRGEFGDQRLARSSTVRETQIPQMLMPGFVVTNDVIPMGYGMGWMMSVYRGHYYVQHGGGIDGFSALVAMLPRDDMGIVVLTNSNSGLPNIVARTAFDRMLGLEDRNWSEDARQEMRHLEETMERTEQEQEEARIKGTTPAHDLAEYAGLFQHPAFGRVAIEQNGAALHLHLNDMDAPLKHWHFEVFSAADGGDAAVEGTKVMFLTSFAGDVDSLQIQTDPTVKPIIFERLADPALKNADRLQRYTGVYKFEIADQRATFEVRGDLLTVTVPGQPTYELEAMRPLQFKFKTLEGFTIKFVEGANDEITSAVFVQPNGVFTAVREAEEN